MRISQHVLYAIDDFQRDRFDSALLFACIAVDATARKLFPSHGVRERYVACLRAYCWLIEPMIGPGLNLETTRFSNISTPKLPNPDFAEFFYTVFRCSLAHGDELPEHFKLVRPPPGAPLQWHLGPNSLQIPFTVLWALVAVAVFAKVNSDESSTGNPYIELAGQRFVIADSWGKEDFIRPIADAHNTPRVTLEKLDRLLHNETPDPSLPDGSSGV